MVVIVTGDREYKDSDRIFQALKNLQEEIGSFELVHGDAPGADTLADEAGKKLKLVRHAYPAQWERYGGRRKGNPAGPIRNRQMLDLYPDAIVLAFHDYLQNSRGTKDMVVEAVGRGFPVTLYGKNESIVLEQLDWLDDE